VVSRSASPTEFKIEFQVHHTHMSHRRKGHIDQFSNSSKLGFTASIAVAVRPDCIEILLKDSLKAEPSVA
jgi:hypothetical protein